MYRHNKKYQSLVSTAKELFYKYGFRRVSIEEVCKEANVSKMTYYKFFKNKEELAKKILDYIFDDTIGKFHEIWKAEMDIEERFTRMIQMKAEGTKNLSKEFIQDLYANPESELAQYMQIKSAETYKELIGLYKAGQEKGWIRKDLNVEFMFAFMQKMIPQMQDEEFARYFPNNQELILEITRLFLYGFHPRD